MLRTSLMQALNDDAIIVGNAMQSCGMQQSSTSKLVHLHGKAIQGVPGKPLRAFQPCIDSSLMYHRSYLSATATSTCMRRRASLRGHHGISARSQGVLLLISSLLAQECVMYKVAINPSLIVCPSVGTGCFAWQYFLKEEPLEKYFSPIFHSDKKNGPSEGSYRDGTMAISLQGFEACSTSLGTKQNVLTVIPWCLALPARNELSSLY